MNDSQLDRRVKRAFERLTPDVLDSVLSDCGAQRGNVTVISSRSRKRFWRTAVSLAAALALVISAAAGTVAFRVSHTPTAVVSLDVNPSVEIQVNRNDKVIKVEAKNSDAEAVVASLDLSGSSIDLAVSAVVGAMVKSGYLSASANSILLTVDGENPLDASALQSRLGEEIDSLLKRDEISGSVLSQTVSAGEELKALAEQYGISTGKAQLISDIAGQSSRYSTDQLAALSINDLNLIRSTRELVLSSLSAVGTPSDGKYIGQDSALSSALGHSGLTGDAVNGVKSEFDLSDGLMVYEIEFGSGEYQYSYDINALTGEIVSSSREYADGIEDLAKQYSDEWAAWAEAHADEWETWAEQYGGDWKAWAADHASELQAWAEGYSDSWENWADAWETWAKQYFNF